MVQLRRQWYEAYFADVNDSIARDLSRLDAGITAIWPRVQSGDPKALDAVVRATELKAKIQGVVPSGVRMDVTAFVQTLAISNGYDASEAMQVAERVAERLR